MKPLAEETDLKINFLFELTLHNKLTELFISEESIVDGLASLLVSKKGVIYRSIIPSILKWMQQNRCAYAEWLVFRLSALAANDLFLKEFQERWKTTHAKKIHSNFEGITEEELKKRVFAILFHIRVKVIEKTVLPLPSAGLSFITHRKI